MIDNTNTLYYALSTIAQVAARILDALTHFADTGQGDVQRVQGTADEWRLRVGDWRVHFRYEITTRSLDVLRVLPRGEAYR
jgi:mRNA-degrading endonuclease RelE of RelBE toxin-antitoxin system